MTAPNLKCSCISLLILALIGTARAEDTASGQVITTYNEDTAATSWSYQGNGLGIELIQASPDYIRASYSARGLPSSIIDEVSRHCVFGTIIRNLSEQALHYRVADWRYRTPTGQQGAPRTKTEWVRDWHSMGVRFSWSILADDPTFAVGDWVQGLTTLPVPHGSQVSLKIVWSIEGQRYEQWLPDMQCAADSQTGSPSDD